MERNDDIWLKQWKDCLEDFEEEVPVNGWERLQADMQANDPLGQPAAKPDAPSAKMIPFQRWRVAAAAAVVVLVAGAGIWFIASDKAPQVPTIDSPVAQMMTADPSEADVPLTMPDALNEETPSEDEPVVPVRDEAATQKVAQAAQPVRQTANPVAAAQAAPQSTDAETSATVVEESAAEAKREGTPIQVKTPARSEAQRSVNPVYRGKAVTSSEEVGTVNRREVRISTDERMHNVSRFRGGSEATTRSATEITDMDRVYNSFTAHYNELYNKTERLFDNGMGDYNTIDNALFLAGLVKKMQHQRSAADEQLYREIASRLVELQQPNGLWKDSLLDPASHSVDTDTESYICYALAWGLNNGLLSRKQYLDAVRHAWKSIGNCNSEPCLMAAEQVQKLQNGNK